MENLKKRLREFARERDWEQYHSPKNLAMALSVEVEPPTGMLPGVAVSEMPAEPLDTMVMVTRRVLLPRLGSTVLELMRAVLVTTVADGQ